MGSTVNIIHQELKKVLASGNISPYIFRTRLERTLIRVSKLSEHLHDPNLIKEIVQTCQDMRRKLNYISDKSNQTPEGTLSSYILLRDDIIGLLKKVE